MKYKLEELIDSITDTTKINNKELVLINTSDVENGKVLNHSYVENNNLKGQFKKRFQKGDILYSEIRPKNRRFAYIDFDSQYYVASTKLMVLRRKNEIIDNDYLFYILKSEDLVNRLQILAESRSGTFPQITFDELKRLYIDVPEVLSQKKIVKILKNLDEKINNNNQINDNLLKLCNSIFHKYLEENSNDIVYKKIIDIAEKVVTGKTPSTKDKDLWKEEIPFITIPDMHNQVYTIETERKISRYGAKSIIPKNSISVSCIATVGLVSINVEDSQTNQQINSVVMKKEYDLFFLFEYFSEQEEYMKNIAGGSTTYNINKNMFENIEVPYLPIEKMIKFHEAVKDMFNKIKENQLENKNLEKLRDTLLPKLMNGEIDLDKIEI